MPIRQKKFLARVAFLVALCFAFAASAYAAHLHEGGADPRCAACSVSADNGLEPPNPALSCDSGHGGRVPDIGPDAPFESAPLTAFDPRAPPRS